MIRGVMVKMVFNYLTGRQQVLFINGNGFIVNFLPFGVKNKCGAVPHLKICKHIVRRIAKPWMELNFVICVTYLKYILWWGCWVNALKLKTCGGDPRPRCGVCALSYKFVRARVIRVCLCCRSVRVRECTTTVVHVKIGEGDRS